MLQKAFPRISWKKSCRERIIYLTFDDGPVPEVTPWVLDCLRDFNAKATFFCVGDNVCKHDNVFRLVLKEGHSVGNHTFHHLNGWQTPTNAFLEDVEKCQRYLDPYVDVSIKPLMRPPYGRLKRAQWQGLLKKYDIIMWDVLSGDFSKRIGAGSCLKKSIQYTGNGSIVLFHDSVKTIEKLKVVLPKYLQHFGNLGYSFQGL